MEVIEEIKTERGKKLQILRGDLTNIPESHKVDILVLSAFPNDYIPTPTSLIGALFRAGLSVGILSRDKEVDLRAQFHCWLSKEINFKNIRRILCFEPTERKFPFNLIAGIYQSIMPFTITHSIKSVAMPLILTGDQGFSQHEVVKELISTSLFWLSNDSSLEIIKIVERSDAKIDLLKMALKTQKPLYNKKLNIDKYDFFLSYSRKNTGLVRAIHEKLATQFKVFFDTESIEIGSNWLSKINTSLENSERFIVCVSPDYLDSKMCKYEYLFCNLKLINQGDDYVLPIYLHSASLPFQMQILNYHDAREGAADKINEFCDKLIKKYVG
ncbi:TIR domain-containing protein [Aquiflexum sp.]|uniref:TIR domain-containing protein n=1 Tax=Aquiflexum sp. TaxID=1872584 RepID=UPI003594942C